MNTRINIIFAIVSFALALFSFSANAQVSLLNTKSHVVMDDWGNEEHTLVINANTFLYTIYVKDAYNPYYMQWTGFVEVSRLGTNNIRLTKENGISTFMNLEWIAGEFYSWTYGSDTLQGKMKIKY